VTAAERSLYGTRLTVIVSSKHQLTTAAAAATTGGGISRTFRYVGMMTNYPIGPHVNDWAAQKTSYAYVTSSLTTTIY